MKSEISLENLQTTVEHLLNKDGYVSPVAIICTEKDSFIIDARDGFKNEESKEQFLKWLTNESLKEKAYKIIIIAEIWKHYSETDKRDAYQILELQNEKSKAIVREYKVGENGTIEYTTEAESEFDIEMGPGYKELQFSLVSIN